MDYAEWSHKFVATRLCPTAGYGPKAQIRVEAGLHYIKGNSAPYFTVTASVFIPHQEYISGGCLHDPVVKYWPELAPVVALHLSNNRGLPMYLHENGLCHLGIGEYSSRNLQYAADHFRITIEEAEALRAKIVTPTGYNKTEYLYFLALQKPRYHQEADAAIALLDALIEKQGGIK